MKMLLSALFAVLTTLAPQTLRNSATLEGQVMKMGTSLSMAEVTVELVRSSGVPVEPGVVQLSGGSPSRTFKTGTDGRFRFSDVVPGEYRLYATHSNAYAPAEYGQRSPSGLGMPLVLAAGQSKTGITLTMTQTASISGRVTDGNREPAAFTSMLAFRIVYRQGVRTVEVVQSVLTDDRGEYRLFWLVPGRYYLSAMPIQARPYSLPLSFPSRVGGALYTGTPVIALRASDAGDVFEETYLPMYYPGTLDIRSSKPIMLRAGENLRADFNVGPTATRTLQIAGTIFLSAGQPLPNARLELAPRKPEGHSIVVPTANADANGNFSIRGIVPGSYFLYVTSQGGQPFPAPGTPPPPPGSPEPILMTATIPLDIGLNAQTSDLNNLKIQAVTGANIPWQITFEPRVGSSTTPPTFNVSLVRDPDLAGAPPALLSTRNVRATPGNQAERLLRGVGSGDFRVTISGVPKTGYVKSIRLGSADILKDGLHMAGPVRDELQIVVSDNAGQLDGVVLDFKRQPFSNATIALLPEFNQRAGRLDLFKNSTSNEDGKFHFEGVAPGTYKIFAWEDIPPDDWYDPEVVQPYESQGTSVQIEEVKTKTIEVRVIPTVRSEP